MPKTRSLYKSIMRFSDDKFVLFRDRIKRINKKLYRRNFEELDRFWKANVRDRDTGLPYNRDFRRQGTPDMSHVEDSERYQTLLGREDYMQDFDVMITCTNKTNFYIWLSRRRKKKKILFDN